MKLLLIEDEPVLLATTRQFLEQEGYLVSTAANFHQAAEKLHDYQYDCVIVDITLPGGSGLELIQNMKTSSGNAGIIIISAKNSLEDRLRGLDLGSDDYLTKPFHLVELNARIKSVLRRRLFDGKPQIRFGALRIYPDNQTVAVGDQPVELTGKEYHLLLFFVANQSRLLSKSVIAEHLWGDSMDLADSHDFIYTHIRNLRRKLLEKGCPEYLTNRYGAGYVFAEKA